ncbi:Fur family transcriptional regulator [Roseburia sp. MSJ-14]|uniref:Fur family transcriptional regulator n=1 Tax=Roseburia sp. MSJ-14 TaxID=2841514 RepID=UPI001C109B47|nr:Fur family transcriptional regulator [Roseburia sp. MSJ-14]MBU5472541.1 transcriptional repressor [Roseburia sp. MSJ-14]
MLQDDFKKILKEKGLKITKQRMVVLKALASCEDKHLTAEEIYEIVKADFPEIGLATVYRTIQLLVGLDLVESIQLGDGYVRYEIGKFQGEETHHHHHLICLECGKIISFRDDLLDELEARIMESASFQVINHEVKLYGYCKECLEKRQKSQS